MKIEVNFYDCQNKIVTVIFKIYYNDNSILPDKVYTEYATLINNSYYLLKLIGKPNLIKQLIKFLTYNKYATVLFKKINFIDDLYTVELKLEPKSLLEVI